VPTRLVARSLQWQAQAGPYNRVPPRSTRTFLLSQGLVFSPLARQSRPWPGDVLPLRTALDRPPLQLKPGCTACSYHALNHRISPRSCWRLSPLSLVRKPGCCSRLPKVLYSSLIATQIFALLSSPRTSFLERVAQPAPSCMSFLLLQLPASLRVLITTRPTLISPQHTAMLWSESRDLDRYRSSIIFWPWILPVCATSDRLNISSEQLDS